MLPREVWLVQAGGVVNSLGNGIVFPFIVIYLHNVRGISFAAAGLALAAGAVAALAAGLGAGTFVDRFGGRNTLLLGLLLQAVSFALFPLVREAWHAFVLLALEGAGTAFFWPGQSMLLSRLTPPERTHSGVRAPAHQHEPRPRPGRGHRRPDREHQPSEQLHRAVPARRGHVPRLHQHPRNGRRACRSQVRGAGGGRGLSRRTTRPELRLAARAERPLRRRRLRGVCAPAAVREELRGRQRALGRDDVAGKHAADRADPAAGREGARRPPADAGAGGILGPAIGGPLLGWHPLAVWPLAAAISVFAAFGCLALERRLPERVLRSPVGERADEGEPLPKPAPA